MDFNFKSYDNSKQSISYCEVDKCKKIIELKEQLQAKEQECEELKEKLRTKARGWANVNDQILKEVEQITDIMDYYKQTLTEIKEVLQFYNNSTIGVDKGNGIFELEVSNDNIGKLIYCYDTNPAKEALQKISEVENVRN